MAYRCVECKAKGIEKIWVSDSDENGLVLCECSNCGHEWEQKEEKGVYSGDIETGMIERYEELMETARDTVEKARKHSKGDWLVSAAEVQFREAEAQREYWVKRMIERNGR